MRKDARLQSISFSEPRLRIHPVSNPSKEVRVCTRPPAQLLGHFKPSDTVQRLVFQGRRRELGLAAATLVPLAEACEQPLANRMLARSGGDPLADKRPANPPRRRGRDHQQLILQSTPYNVV